VRAVSKKLALALWERAENKKIMVKRKMGEGCIIRGEGFSCA
jgi:hypothetical protein